MAMQLAAIKEFSIGIIGVGSMGTFISRAILRGEVENAKLAAIADILPLPADLLQEFAAHGVLVRNSFNALADLPLRLVIECANQEVARDCVPFFVERGVDVLVMSTGVFVDEEFHDKVWRLAGEKQVKVYLPSGAVGAIDALQAALLSGLDEVLLTTRKPPAGLPDQQGEDIKILTEPKVLFDGFAREAVAKFPKNVNVAATISLAGLGPDRTRVRIMVDPTIDKNVHEIQARGAFGSFEMRVANNPSPQNPKTSFLASLSVLALLKKIGASVKVGT